MKILLIKDIKPIGKKGDVVDVSSGYARNFIIPRKIGTLATKKHIEQYIKNKKAIKEKLNKKNESIKKIYGKLNKNTIKIYIKTGKNGEVFSAVHKKDIEEKVFSLIKNLDSDNVINIDDIESDFESMKKTGLFDIHISVGKGDIKKILSMKLEILSDKEK